MGPGAAGAAVGGAGMLSVRRRVANWKGGKDDIFLGKLGIRLGILGILWSYLDFYFKQPQISIFS